MTRITATGLENGRKRILKWQERVLTGDEDLQERFRQAWDATDHKAFRKKLRQAALAAAARYEPGPLTPERRRSLTRIPASSYDERLAADILRSLFAETLDFEHVRMKSPKELQKWADAWNSHKGNPRHHTLEDMQRIHEQEIWASHHGPPYDWKEIERVLTRQPKKRGKPPDHQPKCLECLQPMEWIWFTSSPRTWEMLCGRAGWTPICRACHTWRACRVSNMN